MTPPGNRNSVNIATIKGPEQVEIVVVGDGCQLNVYAPGNGGAGLFALFESLQPGYEALDAVRGLLSGEPLADNLNITDRIPGALTAGTVPRPKFDFTGLDHPQFGIPAVHHAEKPL